MTEQSVHQRCYLKGQKTASPYSGRALKNSGKAGEGCNHMPTSALNFRQNCQFSDFDDQRFAGFSGFGMNFFKYVKLNQKGLETGFFLNEDAGYKICSKHNLDPF